MTRMNSNIFLAVIALLTAAWHQVLRADDLLKLVDGNTAACLHVQGLTENMKKIEESAFAKRLRSADLYENWLGSNEYKQLLGAGAMVSTASGSPVRQTIETLFGREFVVSLSLTTGAAPSGAVMIKADSEAIKSLLAAWDRIDKQDRTKRESNGTSYFASRKAGSQASLQTFYVILEDVFALSHDEAQIKRIIELAAEKDSRESLAGNADFEPATWRREKSEVVSVFVNPRAFDSLLQAGGDVPSFARSAWKRCRWLTLRGLFENNKLQFQLIADYDSQAAPDWWRKQVGLQAERKLPLDQVPASALVTMSGHVASGSVRDVLKSATGDDDSMPKDVRQVRRVLAGLLLGADPLDDLLPMFGPRWLFFSVPREPAESIAFPLDGLVAIELQLEGTADQKDRTKAGLENALKSGLNALAAVHNAKTSGELSVLKQRGGAESTIHWAEPVTTFRPAFAVTDRHLILSTAPEICESFVARESQSFRSESSRSGSEDSLANNNQLIVANAAEARKLLETHSDWFIRRAKRDNVSKEEAARRLAELKDALGLIDRTWISVSGDSDTLTATFGASIEK
jgi:hypothetical protein